MYTSEKYKAIYIGVPRAASQATAKWFQDHYQGKIGPGVWHVEHHTVFPCDGTQYCVFMTIRSPFRRVLSQWAAERLMRNPQAPLHEANFLPWLRRAVTLAPGFGPDAPPLRMRDMQEATGCPERVHLVNVQRLHEELKGLPFVTEFTPPVKSNSHIKGNWRRYYSQPLAVELVRKYYRDDFLAYCLPMQVT